MRRIVLLFLLIGTVNAQVRTVRGVVTYVASGTVYTSMGRNAGVTDSLRISLLDKNDTVAVLKVFAASSKSSVCTIVAAKREIKVGDSLVASIGAPVSVKTKPTVAASPLVADSIVSTSRPAIVEKQETPPKPIMELQGRIALQYTGIRYATSSLNMDQPGIVTSLRGNLVDVPVHFDLYGTFRSVARGNVSPFGPHAETDTRIYRAAVEYDDQTTIISLGRIMPTYAASVGSVDGLSLSRRFGKAIIGVSAGAQPVLSTRDQMPAQRKFVLFGNLESSGEWNAGMSGAYSRAWSAAGIEREVVSASFNSYSLTGFSLYASGDVDLRSPSSSGNPVKPGVSLLLISANYRLTDFLTLGGGFDASRPVYTTSFAQTIQDSLLDKKLRTGVNLTLNATIARGIGVYNTFTPRMSDAGFGKEYSNSTMLYLTNLFSTGVSIRSNVSLNRNEQARVTGGGAAVQKSIFGVDLGLRFQQSKVELMRYAQTQVTQTVGVDCSALLLHDLMMVASYDRMKGFGDSSQSLFFELSWRF